MSATNWDVCPRCINQANNRLAELAEVQMKPNDELWEEYHDLQDKLANKWSHENGFQTLREDFEIGLSADELLFVQYSAHCDNCGLDKEFLHKEKGEGE